mmetsp:Transcript_538/g.719  ORF Transcript_538/g.719 Transcript_538/m.719 type:complete len:235 (-) Transcript_538:99-803(-)
MLVGMAASFKLWHLLSQIPQDAFGIGSELKFFFLVSISLHCCSFAWVIIKEKFGLQFPFAAYGLAFSNLLLFYFSFLLPFFHRSSEVAPSFHLIPTQTAVSSNLEEEEFSLGNMDNVVAILNDTQKFKSFLEICQSHFIEELPRFLRAVHQYKMIEPDAVKKQYAKYLEIVEDFVCASAPYEVNLSWKMKREILMVKDFGKFCTVDGSERYLFFDASFDEILKLLCLNFNAMKA